ncbi:alpha/beta-type small acid-soluble spore protein [Desulfoscipio geothermicus]|jgi:flagellin-specific chaperone FliS|uniref:Small, acid-soluble spore protein, alpha/beta type n=1 Tax=Desulfoscipio geothermicus DSM 3669 TaxID=1121426 RepID=A0A1I6DQS0_9FIRM|nr:alpha/beta-type small acid-soluble spore protein [Desulfoscipio geothermicus]SFR07784.1 Small, acid-soluble spore protein, alpha/beta type [Desulfoscipio geothermicus DSM 3669]
MAEGQRTNRKLIPQAAQAMEQFKYETAAELGIQNYQGYLGDLPSRLNGAVGGNMVKKMIAAYEQSLAQGQQPATPQVTNQQPTP